MTINNDFGTSYIPTTLKKLSQISSQERLYGNTYTGRSSPAEINRVANDTLGFSEIFVVGLPERSDKRDALVLSAALTGFHVEWVDGVEGETIPDKAVPFGINRYSVTESNLGSWRGHMNAIRRIVEEDLESALIMEDDMDRDVRLRSQLEEIAKGSRMLLNSASSPSSPYGDGWDILWIGHCGEPFPEYLDENKNKPGDRPGIQYMKRRYAIEDNITVPPPDRTTGMIDFHAHPYTRFVHICAAPICSFAYALSQSGAQKVLFDLSVDHLTGAFDNALAGLCRRSVSSVGEENPDNDRGLDTKCISVTPPVFFHHKAKGFVSGDSDIHETASGDVREKGTTENIMWSARNNIYDMIMDGEMESQF
ncbi:family 25 glycosyltransferase [Cryphonectria parasitica EP155]|uniref:Family 25 glycosyltransferase n=1 Tax=Cryphonectria parasitica (strain ATCC 38755 / EP155) TaxID=660469 RepID=A0A9P5CW34_CRYP1|nr:family 25 glycosyltransferase [Cryphonectria parasitica EP155]KAF3771411.1 family 25 glycosyltransferase [Cryphonectria parasitica EP155]